MRVLFTVKISFDCAQSADFSLMTLLAEVRIPCDGAHQGNSDGPLFIN